MKYDTPRTNDKRFRILRTRILRTRILRSRILRFYRQTAVSTYLSDHLKVDEVLVGVHPYLLHRSPVADSLVVVSNKQKQHNTRRDRNKHRPVVWGSILGCVCSYIRRTSTSTVVAYCTCFPPQGTLCSNHQTRLQFFTHPAAGLFVVLEFSKMLLCCLLCNRQHASEREKQL